MLDEDGLRRGGAALHAVDHDHVGPGGDGQLDVVGHPGGADLDVDGNLPAGGLAQLLDLDAQIVGTGPVGVAGGRALIDADGKGTHAPRRAR